MKSARLSLDDAAALFGQMGANHRGPLSLPEASQQAAQNTMSEYRELIATLPTNWPQRCVAWLRCNGPSGADAITSGDVFALESWMKQALLSLIAADGLTPEIVTRESLADLAKLRKECTYFNLIPRKASEEAVVEATPQPVVVDPLAEVVIDFRSMHSSAFRHKYLENAERRKLYERACSEGKI